MRWPPPERRQARQPRRPEGGRLHARGWVWAVVGVCRPFAGLVMGALSIILASIARKRAREAGGAVDKNSLVFGIVVTVVWTVLWLFVLVPALLN